MVDSEVYEDRKAFTHAQSLIQQHIKDTIKAWKDKAPNTNVSKWLNLMETEIIGWRPKDFL